MGRHGGAAHFRKLDFVEDVEESKALDRVTGGAVIISASGMCEAGRIKFHLRSNLPRRESTILITGFQAAGTLGRRLVDGAKRVHLLGEDIPVRADLYTLGGLSAHADRTALLAWLSHFRSTREEYAGGGPAAAQRPFRSKPRQVFVVHGEEAVATGFAADLQTRFGWDAMAPTPGHSVILR
jgi:metallo-beta-lactamase family protein